MDLSSKNKIVLVTGASGQFGRKLIPELIRRGYAVRAHFRSEEKARRWCPQEAEAVYGDLTEPSWLSEAVNGCAFVIHGAAKVSLRSGRIENIAKINVDGTRAVVDACRENRIKRLVHVSSIAAVGASTDGTPLDETAPFNLSGFDIPYFDTKQEAERIALDANDADLETIIVNPAIMISPPDRKLTDGDRARIPKRIPIYFDFGINLVQTEDVVDGAIKALEKGRAGQRYILAGENVSSKRLVELVGKFMDIKRPFLKIPHGALYMAALLTELLGSGYSPIKKVFPASKLNRNFVRLAGMKFYYSSEKAKKELGYDPRPLEQSLSEIIDAYFGQSAPADQPIKKAVV